MKLALDEQPSGGVTLFPDQPSAVYSPDYAQQKADKLAVVLGQASPGGDILTSDVASGGERQWLEVVKNQEDNANLAQRNELITNIISNRDTPLTTDDIDIVQRLSRDELYSSDVGTILEKKYAELYTTQLVTSEESAIAQEALEENEEASYSVMDALEVPMQRVQIVEDILQNTKSRYDSTSWADWGTDLAKSVFIPGYDTIKNREQIETEGGDILLGENIEEQLTQLWSLPPEEFRRTLETTVNSLAEDNMIAAMEYIMRVQRYSTSDQAWDNITTGLDFLGGLGTIASVAKMGKGLKTMGKVINTPAAKLPQLAAQAGFNKSASVGQVTTDLLAGDLSGVTTVARIEEIGDKLPSLFNPQKIMQGGTRLDAEATARLKIAITQSSDEVLTAVREGNLVDRLEPVQISKAVREAQDQLEEMFPSNVHNIIDTSVIAAAEDRITNTAVMVAKMGRKDGSLFVSEKSAKQFASKYIGLKTDDYKVMQDTLGGYYIEVRRPLADVGDWRRQVIETELKTPDNLNGKFARFLRSADTFLPESQTMARGTAVHSAEYLSKIIDDITKPFRGKNKEWYSEMDAMMTTSQTNRRYFQNIGEFESAFYKKFSKAPTQDQYEAYFRYVQINDLDYMVRDANAVKRMTSQGFRQMTQKIINKEGTQVDEAFIGRRVDALPTRDQPYKIRIIQGGKETNKFSSFSKNWDKNKALVDNLLAKGWRIVEDYDQTVYTITRDFKDSSIKMKSLGYKEGGHFIPKYDFYISQGKFEDLDGTKVYTGDLNFGTAVTQKQALEIADLFDQARKLVKANDSGAKKFIDDNLPIPYGKFIQKVKAGAINLDVPFLGRKSGTATVSNFKYESIFSDYKLSRRNTLAKASGRFEEEAADELLDVYTTNGKQVFQQDWSSVLSPMDALSSATRNMINVRVLEDYAMKSANDWIQEHGHKLDVDIQELKANPRYYMRNPKYRDGAGIDTAEASRQAALALFNEVDHGDISRTTFRDKALNTAFNVSPDWIRKNLSADSIYTAHDAYSLIRGTAFHLKLGTWNVKQMFQQGVAAMNVVAISPRAGWAGLNATPMTMKALYSGDPKVLNGLYNIMGKISGWEKQDWLDMVKSMKQSGFGSVGGDMSYLDRMNTKGAGKAFMGQLREGIPGKILKTSTKPFETGEIFARSAAYGAAWREWKVANPGKAVDRFAQNQILQRAKDMTLNMTRDSNAAWQKNGFSVMTQFFSYQARVAEALWSNGLFKDGQKLTKQEKLRLLGLNSALYGVGTSVSMGTVFIPTTQVIKQWLAEEGIDAEATPGAEIFLDGAPSFMVKAVAGADVDFSTYGPSGLPTLFDLFNEDKSWADKVLGAGVGVLGDVGEGLWGLKVKLGYEEGGLTVDDVLSVARNASSIDNATKTMIAINTGKWISKRGSYLTDVTTTEALMAGILGTNPMAVTDTFVQMQANKNYLNDRKKALREYEAANVAANRALEQGDEEDYLTYRKRRDAIGIMYDLTPSEKMSVGKRTLFDNPISQEVGERAQEIERRYKTFSDKK